MIKQQERKQQTIVNQKKPWPENLLSDVYGEHDIPEAGPDREVGLQYLLSQLTEQQQKVLDLHYKERLTLQEAGDRLGVSRERVRQRLAKALRVIRTNHLFFGIWSGCREYCR